MHTYDETLAALRRAVAKKGADYVYVSDRQNDEACFYTATDGSPSCIVGHVFAELEPALLAELKTYEDANEASRAVADLGRDYVLFEEDALDLLIHAQTNQDCGNPWGAAVDEADKSVKSEWGGEK